MRRRVVDIIMRNQNRQMREHVLRYMMNRIRQVRGAWFGGGGVGAAVAAAPNPLPLV